MNKKGFTVLELLVLISIFGIILGYGVVYKGFFAGNYWFAENDVLRKIQLQDNTVEKVIDTERNVFFKSIIVTSQKGENGQSLTRYWKLDTNILFSYKVIEKSR